MNDDHERPDSESDSTPVEGADDEIATSSVGLTMSTTVNSVRVKLINQPYLYAGIKAVLMKKGEGFTKDSISFEDDDKGNVHVVWRAVGATHEQLVTALESLEYSVGRPVRVEKQ